MINGKCVSFHIDMDSPDKLLDFYKIKNVSFGEKELNRFYEVAMNRALALLAKYNIQATFFCVGSDLEKSCLAREMLKKSFEMGHEIANHTYSHVFGLANLNDETIQAEIAKGSDIIKDISGTRPIGFRSPGYSINSKIINMLEGMGYIYDSSGFWSILNVIGKAYHRIASKGERDLYSGFGRVSRRLPSCAYFPSRENWLEAARYREIVELPLPRTPVLNFPFYSNFHLMFPPARTNLALRQMNKNYFIYLLHLVEFVDLGGSLPEELKVHPNLKKSACKKINLLSIIIENILQKYTSIKTVDFVNKMLREKIVFEK